MSETKASAKSKKSDSSRTPANPALRRVRFLAKIEGAKEVVLTGDFTKWAKDQIKLNHIGSGEWEAIFNLAPGEYQYRLLVDGEWRDHAQAAKRVPNAFGSENCVLTV
jgi:hypothetical protein